MNYLVFFQHYEYNGSSVGIFLTVLKLRLKKVNEELFTSKKCLIDLLFTVVADMMGTQQT